MEEKKIYATFDTVLAKVQKAYDKRPKGGSGEKAIIDALKEEYGVDGLKEDNQFLKRAINNTQVISEMPLKTLLEVDLGYKLLTKQIDETIETILDEVEKAFANRQTNLVFGHAPGSGEKAVIETLKKYGVNDLKEDDQYLKEMVSGPFSSIEESTLTHLLTNRLGYQLLTNEEKIVQSVYHRVIEKNGSLNDFTKALKLDGFSDPTLKANIEKLFKDLQKNNGKFPYEEMDQDLLKTLEINLAAIVEAHSVDIGLTKRVVDIYNSSSKDNKPPTPEQFAERFLEGSDRKDIMKETTIEIGKILASQYPKGKIDDNLKSLEAKPGLWEKFMHYLTKVLTLGFVTTSVDLKRAFTTAKKSPTDGIKSTSFKEHAENKPKGIQQGK